LSIRFVNKLLTTEILRANHLNARSKTHYMSQKQYCFEVWAARKLPNISLLINHLFASLL